MSLGISKESQLKHTKTSKTNKLSKDVLLSYKDYIFELSGGLCQCGCGRNITEFHHADFGINKDDKTLVGIAQHPCHYNIHHGKDVIEKRRLINLFKEIGDCNWSGFNG